MADAQRSIDFVDGISSSLLVPEFYALLAKRTQQRRQLRVRFVTPSDQQLFLRSQHHERARHPEDRRTFDELLERKTAIAKLPDRILERVPHDTRDEVSRRISVQEWHLPAHLVLLKIDRKLYLSLPAHRRHSRTVTLRLEDRTSPLYQLALGYLRFVTGVGRVFLTGMSPQLVPLVDDRRAVRMALPRDAVRALGYRTRIVFGLVLDGTDRLLVRMRRADEHDNRGMWDKSFGGHEDWGTDEYPQDVAIREFVEELFPNGGAPELLDVATYTGLRELVNRSSDAWPLVALERWPEYKSRRVQDGQEVDKPLDVMVFGCVAMEPELVNPDGASYQHRWVPLAELGEFLAGNPVSPDLSYLAGSGVLPKLAEFSELVPRKRRSA